MCNSRLEVDLGAIERNLGVVRSVLSGSQKVSLCAVIKQDAYSLGAVRVAKRLAAAGADMLAVYSPDEARVLADAPLDSQILVLMPVRHFERSDVLYRLAVRSRLHLTLHDASQAADLATLAARVGLKLPVHVQVDTGLSRGGALPTEAARLVELVASNPRFALAGVMTHFNAPAHDDAFTREQARAFRSWIERVRPMLPADCMIHAANSAATFRSHQFHANMVRVGQALFGYCLEDAPDPQNLAFGDALAKLEPALRWTSRVVHVAEVPAGWPVGYGLTYRAQRKTRVALIPVGYVDGYPLSLSNRGVVGFTNKAWDRYRTGDVVETIGGASRTTHFAPVIGRVSMDQITVDVTDLPESACRVGAEVELVSRDRAAPNHLPALARLANTISHDLLARLSPRLEREYLSSLSPAETTPAPAAAPAPAVVASPSAPHVLPRIANAG